jgi:hypothetical protein
VGKYLSAQQTASALIAKKGGSVTLKRARAGSFDPITQSRLDDGTDSWTFTAIIFPASSQSRYKAGTLQVELSDEGYFALDNGDVRPQPGDVLTAGGIDYKVTWSQTYDPAGDGPIFTHAFLLG